MFVPGGKSVLKIYSKRRQFFLFFFFFFFLFQYFEVVTGESNPEVCGKRIVPPLFGGQQTQKKNMKQMANIIKLGINLDQNRSLRDFNFFPR